MHGVVLRDDVVRQVVELLHQVLVARIPSLIGADAYNVLLAFELLFEVYQPDVVLNEA